MYGKLSLISQFRVKIMKKTAFCLTFILLGGTAYTGFSQTYGGNDSEFFIPQNAMVQRVEKLPPINIPQRGLPSAVRPDNTSGQNGKQAQTAAKPQQQRKIIRYEAVDGRFIPIYAPVEENAQNEIPLQNTGNEATGGTVTFEPDETDATPETATANSVFAEPEADNNQAPLNTPSADELAKIKDMKQMALNPQFLPPVKVPTASVQSGLPDYRNRYAQYLADLKVFSQNKKFPQNEELNASLNKMDSNREILIYKK